MEDSGTYEDKVVHAEMTFESLKDTVHDQHERIKELESCIKKAREYMEETSFYRDGTTLKIFDMRFASNMEFILWEVEINECRENV